MFRKQINHPFTSLYRVFHVKCKFTWMWSKQQRDDGCLNINPKPHWIASINSNQRAYRVALANDTLTLHSLPLPLPLINTPYPLKCLTNRNQIPGSLIIKTTLWQSSTSVRDQFWALWCVVVAWKLQSIKWRHFHVRPSVHTTLSASSTAHLDSLHPPDCTSNPWPGSCAVNEWGNTS